MHSNINRLKITAPLKMIQEGLLHTQKVYKGVKEFTNLVKDYFQRLRPCRDDTLNLLLRSIDVRCGKYGFFSAHASNSIAVSVFIYKLFNTKQQTALNYFLLLWVVIFSYSRIYLGVHYPLDIIFGLIFGLIFGTLGYKILENFLLIRSK